MSRLREALIELWLGGSCVLVLFALLASALASTSGMSLPASAAALAAQVWGFYLDLCVLAAGS